MYIHAACRSHDVNRYAYLSKYVNRYQNRYFFTKKYVNRYQNRYFFTSIGIKIGILSGTPHTCIFLIDVVAHIYKHVHTHTVYIHGVPIAQYQ